MKGCVLTSGISMGHVIIVRSLEIIFGIICQTIVYLDQVEQPSTLKIAMLQLALTIGIAQNARPRIRTTVSTTPYSRPRRTTFTAEIYWIIFLSVSSVAEVSSTRQGPHSFGRSDQDADLLRTVVCPQLQQDALLRLLVNMHLC